MRKKFLVATVILFGPMLILAARPAPRANPPKTMPAANEAGLKSFDGYLFDQNETGKRKGKRTDAALLMRDGQVLYEKYARGYDPSKKHIMWSTSKTAMALLLGVAEKDHLARRDQSICDFLKNVRKELCRIRIQDLLQWSSGLRWREEYENASTPRVSSVLAMLYGEGRGDMAQFVLGHEFDQGASPGQTWRYSSGDSILLAAVLGQIYHGQDLREVFREKLYGPLGMNNWLWEADAAGTISGSYYFFVSAQDLARLGRIFMNDGVVDGKKIVDRDFIDFMRTVPESFIKDRRDHGLSRHVSGAHLWLNKSDVPGFAKPWPSAPDDTVVTMGHWGQFLVVIPSLKVEAVRLGDNRDHSFLVDEFVARVIEAATGAAPLPSPKSAETKAKALATTADEHLYKDGIISLGLRFTARAYCSCLFVAKNNEATCRDYASLEQVSPRLSVDYERKQTKSSLFFIFAETAEYMGAGKGCVAK